MTVKFVDLNYNSDFHESDSGESEPRLGNSNRIVKGSRILHIYVRYFFGC